MSGSISRRRFMAGVATVGGALFAGPYVLRAAQVNKEKLRMAFIGTAGRGGAHIPVAKTESCPCFCDANEGAWTKIKKFAPAAVGYTDYRKMYDRHMKEIDAVVIATPDHHHFMASMLAVSNGKHCYTEKPLACTVTEVRAMCEMAQRQKVATQLGNGGNATEATRLTVEWVQGGVIGDVTEVHTWTNRPIWPQGLTARPPKQPVPAGLDWESWIGPAPFREYHDGLHPFKWRGWFDFGTGAIGDMACHNFNCVFWAMGPDYPTTVELMAIEGRTQETWPTKAKVKWTFPAKGKRPGFTAYWYEGKMMPPVPDEMKNDPYWMPKVKAGAPPKPAELPDNGSLFIGTKGKMLVTSSGASVRLIPESFMQSAHRPDKTLPRSPGHMEEFLMACRGEKPVDYPGTHWPRHGGPLTEIVLLAGIAIRLGEVGAKFECDPESRTIKTPAALEFASRTYRKGWGYPAVV